MVDLVRGWVACFHPRTVLAAVRAFGGRKEVVDLLLEVVGDVLAKEIHLVALGPGSVVKEWPGMEASKEGIVVARA